MIFKIIIKGLKRARELYLQSWCRPFKDHKISNSLFDAGSWVYYTWSGYICILKYIFVEELDFKSQQVKTKMASIGHFMH